MTMPRRSTFLRISSTLLVLIVALSASAHEYESIIKNEEFRAGLRLAEGAGFVELSEGYTFYRTANMSTCEDPIVLVHGFSVPSYIWEPTFDFLEEKQRCVVMLDLYGRGFSDNPDVDYTDSLFASQVLELMDHFGLKRATLVGLSNGGRVISQLAGQVPQRVNALIYVASSGFRDAVRSPDTRVTQAEIDALIATYPMLPEGQLADFKYPDRFPDWADKYEDLLIHKGFARALISTRKHHDSTKLDRIHADLQESTIPVTTIWGDSDRVVVYADFAEKINRLLPRRDEYVVPEAGHLPHMENPEYFHMVLSTILKN
jgi:pimeloyl-ACP methyl ester carboxylesterase